MKIVNRISFPVVPLSFILLLLVGSGIYWWFTSGGGNPSGGGILSGGDTLKVFRVPGGTLTTSGLVKTEQLWKSDESGWWLGTTSSVIRVDATYTYVVELRSDWNFAFDEDRKVAFVIAPELKPQLPVAIDTKSIQEETSSGWARFDKWEHLSALRRELSPFLEKKAISRDYRDLVRDKARLTIEDFVSDWIIKERGWKKEDAPVVKVYFEEEEDIPFPSGKTLSDFRK